MPGFPNIEELAAHVTAEQLQAFLQTPVPAGLAAPPSGFVFDPFMLKALLRATEFHATAQGTVPPSNAGKKVYAIAVGRNGVRPGTIAEAAIDVNGWPKGARLGFTNAHDAVVYCDIITWHLAIKRIRELLEELHQRRAEVAASGSRMTAFSDSVRMQNVQSFALGDPAFTTSITRLPFPSSIPTPTSLVTVVANHLVQIHCNLPVPSNPLNVYSDHEGMLDVEDTTESVIEYSEPQPATAFGPVRESVKVEVSDTGMPLRVVPFSRLAAPDMTPASYPCVLQPVLPLPVDAAIITAEEYYWVVFQGRRVGIFKATAKSIQSLLPDTYSTATACLTLEEASAMWRRQLGRGYQLTELIDVPSVEEEIAAGLEETNNEPAAAAVLAGALAA